MDVSSADQSFFDALTAGDVARLGELLTDDFRLVDVMAGSVFGRDELVGGIEQGAIAFESVRLVGEREVRRHGATAVVIGRTEMTGAAGGRPFTTASRYTHVFVEDEGDGRLRMLSAQGTPVADET